MTTVYNPQPSGRDDTPTAATETPPAPRSREMAVIGDEDAADYRELLAALSSASEDDETDDASVCAAVDLATYLSFDDGEEA